MELHVSIDRPRWLPRLSSRRRKLAAALAIAGLVGAPAGVLASDRFSDIPTSSPQHEIVDKIADAGIVRGCGDATRFCPDRNLTRLEMAQWFSRGGSSVIGESGGGPTLVPGQIAEAIDLDVDVPGIVGNQQAVKVDADVTITAPNSDGCPCRMRLFLQDGENPSTQFGTNHFVTLLPVGAGNPMSVAASLSFVFVGETGTQENYLLTADNTGGTATLNVSGDLTATVFPFPN